MTVKNPPIQEKTTSILGLFPQVWIRWFRAVKICLDEITAIAWDDLRVPVTATTDLGSTPPTWGKITDDGVVGTGFALSFDEGNDETIKIPSNAALNFDASGGDKAFSIGFWIRIPIGYKEGYVVAKAGDDWRLETIKDNRIRFKTASGVDAQTPKNTLVQGAIHCVVVTIEAISGGGTTATIYIDNVLQDEDTDGDELTDVTDDIFIGSRDDDDKYADFDLDELRIWNSVLTEGQISTFYNGGNGTESPIATEICGYHFNEGTGTDADNFEGTSALDIDFTTTGNDPSWINGFIDGSSRGVYTWFFDPDNHTELHFTAQFPHDRKNSTDIYPHVHWVANTNGGVDELVRWGLEYFWVDINDTFTTTSTIYGDSPVGGDTTMVSNKHYMTNLTVIDGSSIGMSGAGVSSMLMGRIFRDSSNDDYTGFAGLLEIDFHYEIDSRGSRTISSK